MDSPLQFNLTSNYGVIYTPANDPAKKALANLAGKNRKGFKAFELVALIEAGADVEVNLNPYLGVSFWVKFSPKN